MIAFLDACVLYPAVLRDVLLSLSEGGLYQIRWSPHVLDEVERNLLKNGKATGAVRSVMQSAFPDAMVSKSDYTRYIQNMPNHPKDRHVLAAAIVCEADVLVTANLKDFSVLPDICTTTIQHPNDFLLEQLHIAPREFFNALKRMAANRKSPMDTVPGILNILHTITPGFVMHAFDVIVKYVP